MRLYQFAILWHPRKTDSKKGAAEKSKVLMEPKTILAGDEKSALILASREIPEDYVHELDQVEIAIRPF